MLLHDDVLYQILKWLPVTSLLRFKLVCRTWRALIESNDFIKHHLHLHHYDPNLKDKHHILIYPHQSKDSPITFALTSTEGFEELNASLQLNCSDLHGYFCITVFNMVSYNGIICLELFNSKKVQMICLWNPVTKQSRVLPQSPTPNKFMGPVGFGFDIKNNDYKVVNLLGSGYPDGKRVEVYNLSTNAWRRVTTVFPLCGFTVFPRRPFNNGTCFFWLGFNSCENAEISCFDFCSEMFRSISLPCADYYPVFYHHIPHVSVVLDKITCIFRTNCQQMEMWVFNEYGTVNESWTKLYILDTYFPDRQFVVSMNSIYIFFITSEQMCRFNVVTKETNCFTPENMPLSLFNMVEFKESLVSVLDA